MHAWSAEFQQGDFHAAYYFAINFGNKYLSSLSEKELRESLVSH
jgi:hypothetical protein